MNRVSEPLVRSIMAITLEFKLCLSNFRRGIEKQKVIKGLYFFAGSWFDGSWIDGLMDHNFWREKWNKGEDLDCKVQSVMMRHLNILKHFSLGIESLWT